MKRLARTIAFVAAVLFGLQAHFARADAAVAWGNNSTGQLGDGTTISRNAPVSVIGLASGVTTIAGGSNHNHNLAIHNGAVSAWGWNAYGQLGDGTMINRGMPVAVSGLVSGISKIAVGEFRSLAVQNGAVYAWGARICVECVSTSTPVVVSGLTSGVSEIADGGGQNLAVQNGGLYAWGVNSFGQLGDGTTINHSTPVPVIGLASGVTAVAAGVLHSLAVQNGAVYAWGNNFSGQLGDGTTINRSTPVAVSGLTSRVTDISAGQFHNLAVKDGYVYAWGNNFFGRLGDGTTTSHSTPVQIDPTNLNNIVAVAVGMDSSYALSSDGSLWVWGDNYYGQLGLGTNTGHLSPQHLLPPSGYVYTSITAGQFDVTALLAAVPEPASIALMSIGILAIAFRCRSR